MAQAFSNILLKEDWSEFSSGPIHRDSTARGEYMSMVVPQNPGGWYHNAKANGNKDRDHSPLTIRKSKAHGRELVMPDLAWCWDYGVVLTQGEKPWADMRISAPMRIRGMYPVGLVVRYRSNRDFYAICFEAGQVKLVRRLEGAMTVLDSAEYAPPRGAVEVTLTVQGDRLDAHVKGVNLSGRDGCIPTGGIGLLAAGPVAFGAVTVKTTPAEQKRIDTRIRKATSVVRKKRKDLPGMELLADIDVRGHAIGRQIRFANLTGEGPEDILFAVPTRQKGRKWEYRKMARLSALTAEGDVLWERGNIQPDSIDETCDMPFQAADRGKGIEVVAAFGPKLEILDPQTGKTRKSSPTPKTPKMEDYWDEINMYWGDGHFDDLDRLLPDSIRLCNFTGREPYGDLLIKDRYHNAWGIDGRSLKVLWHHACNTGHYAYTEDINGDGKDEVVLGYSRVDSKGNLLGRLYLGDHPDGCFTYVDAWGVRHYLHPCGEAGFIDDMEDGRLGEVHLGHVQHLSMANFCGDKPDLERIIVTYHGNEGIIVMMDSENRILRKAERYSAGSICQPVNWTGDGRELIAFSPRHGDGGLWDENFDLVVPFPDEDRPGKYMEVHDVLGLGVDQLVVWDENRLHIYGPKSRPRKSGKKYTPVRPGPNLSNYQVNYSLPNWS